MWSEHTWKETNKRKTVEVPCLVDENIPTVLIMRQNEMNRKP